MDSKVITVYTRKTSLYSGGGGFFVYVTEVKHWDPLSKLFKKYTHTITYPTGGGQSSDYNINVVGPGSTSGSNKFTYNTPKLRVEAVEVYFKGDDDVGTGNTEPLVVGFVYEKGSKCYYTWTCLKEKEEFSGDIDDQGSISERDLITGLLEEVGPKVQRENKLVIRLDERPNGLGEGGGDGVAGFKYPYSGHFKNTKNKITVKKEDSAVSGYDVYEHSFKDTDSGTVNECYVSYERNSKYFKVANESGYNLLYSVTAYFESSGNKKLVFITFSLTSGKTYEYSYSGFVNDLKDLRGVKWSTDVKTIRESEAIESPYRELQRKLEAESERLRPLIAFVKDDNRKNNDNIKTTHLQEVRGHVGGKDYTFKSCTMTPNTNAKNGPWTVYSSKLIDRGSVRKIQPEDVLKGIFTTDDASITSSSKYEFITVYYSLKDRELEALLVEFYSGDGNRKYIKRENNEGSSWASDTGIDSRTGVTAKELNRIRTEAFDGGARGASGSNTTTGRGGANKMSDTSQQKDIQIYTNTTDSHGYGGYVSKISADDPWDPLSKLFKKYTHTITYPTGGGQSSDYNITVYSKGSGGSGGYGFTYEKPKNKVTEVQVFFRFTDDVKNKEPLIVGFIHEINGSKCYYSWKYVTRRRGFDGTINGVESISDKDLINSLLQELDRTRIPSRQNKLVIKLDEKPKDLDQSTYPESGQLKDSKTKINVKKDKPDVIGFDKYVHTIISSGSDSGVEEFYVSYDNNTRYFKTDYGSESGRASLRSVTVYYKTGGTKNPVLITFSLTSGKTYEYSYSGFVNDLKDLRGVKWSTDVKIITELSTIILPESSFQLKLEAESERLKQVITFVKDDGVKNYNISTQQDKVGLGTMFKKVILKPNTDDLGIRGVRGSSVGPWKVYNNKLFTLESGKKIEEGILSSIVTSSVTDSTSKKYKTITVFYTSDSKALLVEFDQGGTNKTYFRRGNKEGTKWAIAPGIIIDTRGGDSALLGILQQESKRLRPMIEFEKGNHRSENKHIATEQNNFGKGNKFIKFTMTPNTTDEPRVPGVQGGSSVGPWKVFSSKLFTDGSGKTIEEDATIEDAVLKDIFTDGDTSKSGSSEKKYNSIAVYYTSNRKALLVEFYSGDGRKKYIKREKAEGTRWSSESDANTLDDRQLTRKLIEIAKGAKIKQEGISSDPVDGGEGKEQLTHAPEEQHVEQQQQESQVQEQHVEQQQQESQVQEQLSAPQAQAVVNPPSEHDSTLSQGSDQETTGVESSSISSSRGVSNGSDGKGATEAGLVPWFRVGPRVVSWLGRGSGLGLGLRRGRGLGLVSRVGFRVGSSVVSKVRSRVVSWLKNPGGSSGPRGEAGTTTSNSIDSGPTSLGEARVSSGGGGGGGSSSRAGEGDGTISSSVDVGSINGGGIPGAGAASNSRIFSDGRGDSRDDNSSNGEGRGVVNGSSTDSIGGREAGSSRNVEADNGGGSPGGARQVHSNTLSSGSSSLPGADGGGSDGDGSDSTIGGAVGGGVSLIVASGGTGFGIYRYRHVFLSLIGK